MAQVSPMKLTVKKIIEESRGQKIKGKNHYDTKLTAAEMGFINAYKDKIASRKPGGFVDRMVKKGMNQESYIMKGTEPRMVASVESFDDYDEATQHASEYGTAASSGLDNPIHNVHGQEGGDGGGTGGVDGFQEKYQGLMGEFDSYKAGEEARKKAAADKALQEQRDSDRQGFVDDYTGEGGYQSRLQDLEGQFDLSKERKAMTDMAGEAKTLSSDYQTSMTGAGGFADKIGGYAGEVAGLRSGVDTLRQQQAGIGTQIGKLATQAMDPSSSPMYDRNRQMLAGVAEQQRHASDKGAMAQLARGASASGMSPEKLALAQAQLKSGQGARARQDALSSAMGAQQMTGQQLSQGAGLLGQQAGLGMQQANLYVQQAGLGAQAAGLTGQQAGMFGQTAQFGMGALGQRAGLQGQSAGLLQQQLLGRAGLIGGQGKMTEYGLQDVVARQNEQMQMEMAEKANAANIEAARAGSSGGSSGGGGFLSSIF